MAAAPDPTPDSSVALLALVREQREVRDAAEARILAAAVDWAAFHSADSLVPAPDSWESAVPLAGEGAPEVAEFCIAEFAAVLGLSTQAGRELVGDALELAHRLPGVYARVQAGEVPAWRARRIAQATRLLPPAGAAFVDQQVSAFAHRIGIAQLDRVVEEAIVRFDPELARKRRAEADERRRFDVDLDRVGYDGTVQVSGVLDLADAVDLERAVSRRATLLGELGSERSLAVRRSMALGEMARDDLVLDLETGERTSRSAGIELRVHVNAGDLADAAVRGLARVERTRSFIDLDQLREWCSRPGMEVAIRPVIDTAETIRVDRYEIPDRLREQVIERDGTCCFPYCNRPARDCDRDHVVPYDDTGPPGQTSSDNLASLCRGHHRHKTHGRWSYQRIEPGIWLWRSPHGHRFLVTPSGTQAL